MQHYLNFSTEVFLSVFFFLYIAWLLRKAVLAKIEVYDFFMLAGVAAFPYGFVLFPSAVQWVTNLLGVQFPFVVLFGGLNLVIFVFLYRMVIRVNRLQKKLQRIAQQMALDQVQPERSQERRENLVSNR